MLDADEIVDPDLKTSLTTLLDGDPELDVSNVVSAAFFLGTRLRSTSWRN